jgi:hypothetical protein
MRTAILVLLLLAVFLSSCCSIIHPNRCFVNPDRRGDLDPLRYLNVLNAFFYLPLDYATGCAWKTLPPGQIRREDGQVIQK